MADWKSERCLIHEKGSFSWAFCTRGQPMPTCDVPESRPHMHYACNDCRMAWIEPVGPPISVSVKVFASYSSSDEWIVSELVRLLRAVGAPVFRARDDLPPGARWEPAICQAIEDADIVLVFWTHAAASSNPVRSEYTHAIALNKRLVPIYLDAAPPLPPELEAFQYVDLRKMRPSAVEIWPRAGGTLVFRMRQTAALEISRAIETARFGS